VKVVDTIPTTSVTVPSFLASRSPSINGNLDTGWLRKAGALGLMFEPVSYALQAVIVAAAKQGITFRTVGDYRPYSDQVLLFTSRYTIEVLAGRPRKFWQSQWWYQKPGTAMAATPGTSNHGLGLANDIAQEYDTDSAADAIRDDGLIFLRDNPEFGFGLETRAEPWHWHWRHKDRLSQLVVDTLWDAGITIPSLARYGFVVPEHSQPPSEDDMTPRNERIVDTRTGKGGSRFIANSARRIKIPYPATSAYIRLTALETAGGGYFVVGGVQKPDTSAVNFGFGPGVQGQCSVFTGVDPDGTFQVWCDVSAADLTIDLYGTG
jgi:hypothetical protein